MSHVSEEARLFWELYYLTCFILSVVVSLIIACSGLSDFAKGVLYGLVIGLAASPLVSIVIMCLLLKHLEG